MPLRRAVASALLLLCACARLPEIDLAECGNRVVEEPEDCDGFPSAAGAACRGPGSAGQCRWDCSPGINGIRPPCPSGWGCDSSAICRRPTGIFESKSAIELGTATTLLSGDFDGDQRTDLASLELSQASGITRLQFHYFDERADLEETRAFPLPLGAPIASDVSGDQLSDILFSSERIGLLRGRRDRNWVPDAFNSYRIDGSSIRIVSVFSGDVEGTSGFVEFIRYNGADGLYFADPKRLGVPRRLSASPPVEAFVGDPVSGHFLEDRSVYPCAQVVVAARGENNFWLYDTCAKPAGLGDPVWRSEAEQRSIALEPAAPIDGPPQALDLDGDGHLDVLLGAGGRAFVAYGDGQNLATAVPFVQPNALVLATTGESEPLGEIPLPLAAGDISGDGAPDFVFNGGILVSRPAGSGSGFEYYPRVLRDPGYWTRALAADLNRDGHLDFVAASATHPGVDFYNGSGDLYFSEFNIPTNRPVQHLVAGDFNGDSITDLGFSELSAASGEADSLFIAFSGLAGPPGPPAAVAQLHNMQQVAAWRQGSIDHIGVCSEEHETAQLALLESNGDRIPTASYDLTTFASDGSTFASTAVRIATGSFVQPGHSDVLALAFGPNAEGTNSDISQLEAWLVPDLASGSTAVHLAAEFAAEAAPFSTRDGTLSLSAAAADLDRDGRDDAVIAMPRFDAALAAPDANATLPDAGAAPATPDPTLCSVSTFDVGAERLEPRSSLAIAAACRQVELSPWDADGDGNLDLLLLTGAGDDRTGTLSVFWNDGSGHFDAEHRTLLTDAAPRAFTVLQGTTARNRSVAFVNSEGLFLIAAVEQSREFDAPRAEVLRRGCTGVVAADVNGDAAVDLAYAADGDIFILQSGLESK